MATEPLQNAGYPYRGEMIAMMYQYPQLHADASTISWVIPRAAFYDYLEAAVRFLRLEQDASRTRPSTEEQPWEP